MILKLLIVLPGSEFLGRNLRDAEIQKKAENIFFPLPLFYLETKLVSNMQLDRERKRTRGRERQGTYILCTASRIIETPNGENRVKKVTFPHWLDVCEIRNNTHAHPHTH